MMDDWAPGQRNSIERSLRSGVVVPDRAFDLVFPPPWRSRSPRFWTPIHVALRAAAWLTENGGPGNYWIKVSGQIDGAEASGFASLEVKGGA